MHDAIVNGFSVHPDHLDDATLIPTVRQGSFSIQAQFAPQSYNAFKAYYMANYPPRGSDDVIRVTAPSLQFAISHMRDKQRNEWSFVDEESQLLGVHGGILIVVGAPTGLMNRVIQIARQSQMTIVEISDGHDSEIVVGYCQHCGQSISREDLGNGYHPDANGDDCEFAAS